MTAPRTDDTLDAPTLDTRNRHAQTTGAEQRTLAAIFRHPLAHNLAWREVASLFAAIGSIDERHSGEFVLTAGDQTHVMKKPHHKDLTGDDVMELRHFLARAGWSPEAKPSLDPDAATAAPDPAFVVVIDHAGARIYALDRSIDAVQGASAPEPTHVTRHGEARAQDADRDETYPEDTHFFDAVAEAVKGDGEIVVIGHGAGQSNEADHLTAYLDRHHKPVAARIARQLTADLPRLSPAELVDLGRRAIGSAHDRAE